MDPVENPVVDIDVDTAPELVEQRIEKWLGHKTAEDAGIFANGWEVIAALYVPTEDAKVLNKDGTKSLILSPTVVSENARFNSCVGLVIAVGPQAFPKEKFDKPRCKVGDWIIIPRHEGMQLNFRGKVLFCLNDDRVGARVSDPKFVTRG